MEGCCNQCKQVFVQSNLRGGLEHVLQVLSNDLQIEGHSAKNAMELNLILWKTQYERHLCQARDQGLDVYDHAFIVSRRNKWGSLGELKLQYWKSFATYGEALEKALCIVWVIKR